MQGTHIFQSDAKVEIDLESFVAEDHPLRRVDRVLDLAFVRELTAPCYSQFGAPSIDPEVFFQMLLLAYYNLAYRWFCRLSLDDAVADHSSIGRTRDRYGEAIFEAVFRHIVFLCKKDLVSQKCRVMTDATLIAADASLNSLIHNDADEADKEAECQQRARGLKDRSSARCVSNKTHKESTYVPMRRSTITTNATPVRQPIALTARQSRPQSLKNSLST